MFYANLTIVDDKLSCYVMHKYIVIDFECFANEFRMDTSLSKLSVGSFVYYSQEQAISMLFPYSTPRDISEKLLITSLSFTLYLEEKKEIKERK